MNRDNNIIFLCQKIEELYKVHSNLILRGNSDFEKRLVKIINSEILNTLFELEQTLIKSPTPLDR